MRTILIGVFLLFYWLLSLPMFLIGFFLGKKDPVRKHRFSQPFVAWGFRVILWISGIRVTIKGKENILRDGSALYVFNHRSFFDIIVGYMTAPVPSSYVSKKEIAKIPLVSRWMKYMNCLFLDRDDMKQGMKTILEGIALLKNGTSVYIAPEGTRNTGEGLLPFHEASFKLADKSKRPIIPVALNNTDEAFEKHLPWVHSTHIIIEYCEPIYMDQMERAEKKHIGRTVREILLAKTEENSRIG